LTPAKLIFGRELWLPCDLLFGVPPGKELPTTDYATDLVDHLHDIHSYARRHLKLASDRMKTRYDKLANSAGYHEGDRVWLYRPARTKGKSPKLQSSWDGPYKVQNSQNFFWTFSIVLYSKKHDLSETGSVSVLRWRWGRRELIQWLRLALSKGPNWVGVFSPTFTWGRKHIQFPKRRVFWNTRQWKKSRNILWILYNIHHRQNPFKSIHTR
jgi:hypothetical protein